MKLGYVILYVPKVDQTLEFYERAFGMKRRFFNEGDGQAYGELDTGETVLAFASESLAASHGFEFRKTRPETLPPSAEIALVTEQVRGDYDRAVAEGAKPVSPPEEKPWGQTVSYVQDLNGYLIEICSPIPG